MANDRILLRCKFCKSERVLYQFYPVPDGYVFEPETLSLFLTEHLRCHPKGFSNDLAGEPGFDLTTESEPADTP